MESHQRFTKKEDLVWFNFSLVIKKTTLNRVWSIIDHRISINKKINLQYVTWKECFDEICFSSFLLAPSLGNGITRTQWHSDYIIATLSLTPLAHSQLHYSLYPSSLSILLPSFSLSCVQRGEDGRLFSRDKWHGRREVTSGNETRQTCRFPDRPLRWMKGEGGRKERTERSWRWLVRFSRIDWKSETGSCLKKLPMVTCAKGGGAE